MDKEFSHFYFYSTFKNIHLFLTKNFCIISIPFSNIPIEILCFKETANIL